MNDFLSFIKTSDTTKVGTPNSFQSQSKVTSKDDKRDQFLMTDSSNIGRLGESINHV
jgi:hypothetical protein